MTYKLGTTSKTLKGKTIYLDPGHGGKDVGTSINEIYEKDINLEISQYLKQELLNRGAVVLMTREGDYDLSSPSASLRKRSDFDNRIKLINNSNADMYLSIHINYLSQTQYSGAQVFYNKDNEQLANVFQQVLNEELGSTREYKKMERDYYMYKRLNKPGLLVECGFISNYQERKKLITPEYQKKIAVAIANAIETHFKTQNIS